jgi:hypothetical protein
MTRLLRVLLTLLFLLSGPAMGQYSDFKCWSNAAKTIPTATQPNRIYSTRELLRRAEEPGPFHNFPESFNKQIFESGNRTVTLDYFNKARQGLSSDSIQYRLPGTVNGRDGVFEIFARPSTSGNTEVIMHRFFNPKQ